MSFSYCFQQSTLRCSVETFASQIYEPCQISDLQLFLLSKTLCLHWCNNRIVGMVHFIGSRAPVQKNPSMFHPFFEQCKFYFLHVHEVLSVVLDQSIHSFVSMPAGEEHWYHLQPLINLTKMHQQYAKTTWILPALFLNLTLPEMFCMTKLRVKMLKRTPWEYQCILVFLNFIFIINLISMPDIFYSRVPSLKVDIKFFMFKVLVYPMLSISEF